MRIEHKSAGASQRGAAARMVGDVTLFRLDRGEHPETPTADGNLRALKFEFAWLVLVFDQRSMASADLPGTQNTRAFHSKLM
jgi:hypothetical protein